MTEGYTAPVAIGIPLTSDIVFKYVFGSSESTAILRAFLSAVQSDSGFPPITELAILNPYNPQAFPDDKLSILDVRAVDSELNRYAVEVQISSQPEFVSRTLYYWAESYTEVLRSGDPYARLVPVVGVNLVTFSLFPQTLPYHSCFLLTDKDHPQLVLSMDCVLHYLELAKQREVTDTPLEEWVYYIRHRGKEDAQMEVLIKRNKDIAAADERYKRFVADETERARYQAREKAIRDEASRIEQAHQEGVQEGEQRGRTDTARALKKQGVSNEIIARATGLSEGEIGGL